MLEEAPAGNPETVRVTSPVVPRRETLTFTAAPGCPGKIKDDEGDGETERLPCGVELPPLPQPASRSREKPIKTIASVRMAVIVMPDASSPPFLSKELRGRSRLYEALRYPIRRSLNPAA